MAGGAESAVKLAGIFEGGGAKGIAYAGALEVLQEQGCWFSRVAGASAGAITAALIASGLGADDIADRMPYGLDHFRRHSPKGATGLARVGRVARGMHRLTNQRGFFRQDGFADWLESCLTSSLPLPGLESSVSLSGPVTFGQLFESTQIELNIVAADISARRLVVFNWWATPDCSVTSAVLASAGIPFALDIGQLVVPHESADGPRQFVHTLVDGGVWSNFPIFVFTDQGYLAWERQNKQRLLNADPPAIQQDRVEPPHADHLLGFVLGEPGSPANVGDPDYRSADFIPPDQVGEALERHVPGAEAVTPPSPDRSILNRISGRAGLVVELMVRALLLLPKLLPYVLIYLSYPFTERRRRSNLGFKSTVEPGRWPQPQQPALRMLSRAVGTLSFVLQFPMATVLTVAAVTWGGVLVLSRMLDLTLAQNPLDLRFLLLAAVTVVVAVIGGLLVMLLALAPFVVPHLRRSGYGLVTTYATPGSAPPWASYRDDVIVLPIPPGLTTLSFDALDEDDPRFEEALENARVATRVGLERMLGGKSA